MLVRRTIPAAILAALVAQAPVPAAHAATTVTTAGRLSVPGSASGNFSTPDEILRYKVGLIGGRDYAVSGGTGSSEGFGIIVRAPDGRVLGRFGTGDGIQQGVEVRARVTATYFVELRNSGSPDYAVSIVSDCRGDITTKCHLRPGVTQNRTFAYGFDRDFYRVRLSSSDRYRVTYRRTGPGCQNDGGALLDYRGRVVLSAGGFRLPRFDRPFRVPRDGIYYVFLGSDDDCGGPYSLRLDKAG